MGEISAARMANVGSDIDPEKKQWGQDVSSWWVKSESNGAVVVVGGDGSRCFLLAGLNATKKLRDRVTTLLADKDVAVDYYDAHSVATYLVQNLGGL
jgi:hypothetical protein